LFKIKGYSPKRKLRNNDYYGSEEDQQKDMTSNAFQESKVIINFIDTLSTDQQIAIYETLFRLYDSVGKSGYKRIFGVIIPEAIIHISNHLCSLQNEEESDKNEILRIKRKARNNNQS